MNKPKEVAGKMTMKHLTREELERGVIAKGKMGSIFFMGCMCGNCKSGKSRIPCPHCKKISGAPSMKHCRNCGYPLESRKLN